MRSRITGFVRRGSLPLAFFLLFTVALFAQDTPVGVPGTQVATEDTPAAATNTDALRNAAQNPVASLISVPIQSNFNFGIGPADRVQNVLNIQPVIPVTLTQQLEPRRPLDHAYRLSTNPGTAAARTRRRRRPASTAWET